MPDTISLPWEQVEKLVKVLALKLRPILPEFYEIYCISRGGFIVGGMLAYQLGQKKHQVIGGCHPSPGVGVLIVDGICDTGEEMKYHYGWIAPANHTGKVFCATIIRRSTAQFETISAYTHQGDEWFHFPWEPEEEAIDPRDRGVGQGRGESEVHNGGDAIERPDGPPVQSDSTGSTEAPSPPLPNRSDEVREEQLAKGDPDGQHPGSPPDPPPTLDERGQE